MATGGETPSKEVLLDARCSIDGIEEAIQASTAVEIARADGEHFHNEGLLCSHIMEADISKKSALALETRVAVHTVQLQTIRHTASKEKFNMESRFDEMKEKMNEVLADNASFKTTGATLKDRISSLKTESATLKTENVSLNTSVSSTKALEDDARSFELPITFAALTVSQRPSSF